MHRHTHYKMSVYFVEGEKVSNHFFDNVKQNYEHTPMNFFRRSRIWLVALNTSRQSFGGMPAGRSSGGLLYRKLASSSSVHLVPLSPWLSAAANTGLSRKA